MSMDVFILVLLVCSLTKLGYASATCKTVGFQCDEGKKKIEFCKRVNAESEVIETCEGDQVCSQGKNNIRCTDPGNIDVKYICTGKGEFPDLKNCSRTYTCTGEGEEPTEICTCPSETSVYPAPGLFCMPGKCPRESITCVDGAHGYFTLPNKQKATYYYYCLKSDTAQVYKNVEVSSTEVLNEFGIIDILKYGKTCAPYGSS